MRYLLFNYLMPQVLDIEHFISGSSGKNNIIDVRSPKEFEQGHIPCAVNIPLFDNEERAIVGTIYKQNNRQEAVIKGMEIAGPKMAQMITSMQKLAKDNEIYVHCWRGGMRSGFVAMLLKMYGLKVFTLKGGYKSFRNFTLKSFERPLSVFILGGKTGSGKTIILKELKKSGQQVIDLEGIARHKGSAFGALGEKEAPTQEQFENELAVQLLFVDPSLPLWLEDESRLIGKKIIPAPLWKKMLVSKILYLNLPFEERLKYIVQEYGKFSKEQLGNSILKISRRLGPEQTKNSIIALESGDTKTSLEFCLHYYDKTYSYGLSKREKTSVCELSFDTLNAERIAEELIKQASVIK
jgi:tRNA 2-selenouridine synthase